MSRNYRGVAIVTDKEAGLTGRDPATVECCGCPVLAHVIHKTDTTRRVVAVSCIRCVARATAELIPGAILTVTHHIHTFESLAGHRFRDASDPCQIGNCNSCNPHHQVAGGPCLHACHDDALAKAMDLPIASAQTKLDRIRERLCPNCPKQLVYVGDDKEWECPESGAAYLEGHEPTCEDQGELNLGSDLLSVLAILDKRHGRDHGRIWSSGDLRALLHSYRHDIDSKILKGGTIYGAALQQNPAGGVDSVLLKGSPGSPHGDRPSYITERIPLIWTGLVKPDNPAGSRFGKEAIVGGKVMGQLSGGGEWFEMPTIPDDWRKRCTCDGGHDPSTCGAMSAEWKAKIAAGMTPQQIRAEEWEVEIVDHGGREKLTRSQIKAYAAALQVAQVEDAERRGSPVGIGGDETAGFEVRGLDQYGKPMTDTIEVSSLDVKIAPAVAGKLKAARDRILAGLEAMKQGLVVNGSDGQPPRAEIISPTYHPRNRPTQLRELTADEIRLMLGSPAEFAKALRGGPAALNPAVDAVLAAMQEQALISDRDGALAEIGRAAGPMKPRPLTPEQFRKMWKDPREFNRLRGEVGRGVSGDIVLEQQNAQNRKIDAAEKSAVAPGYFEPVNKMIRLPDAEMPPLVGQAQHEVDLGVTAEDLDATVKVDGPDCCASCGDIKPIGARKAERHRLDICGHLQCVECIGEVKAGDRMSHALMCPDGDTPPMLRSFLLELHGDRLRSALTAMLRQRTLVMEGTHGRETVELIRKSVIHPVLRDAAVGAHLLELLTPGDSQGMISIWAGEPGVVGGLMIRRGLCRLAVPDWQGVKGEQPRTWHAAANPGPEHADAMDGWRGEVAEWERGLVMEALRKRQLPVCPLGGRVEAVVLRNVRQTSDDHHRDVAYICRRCRGLVSAGCAAIQRQFLPKRKRAK